MKFPYNRVLNIQKQYQAGKLDREAAKEQLAYLLDLKDTNDFCEQAVERPTQFSKPASYGPLVRLSDVCNILRMWAKTYIDAREEIADAWYKIDLSISKSNLLFRLFFTDEGIRQTPCPEHQGRWSGCDWSSPGCECRNGSDVTGWLPEAEDTGHCEGDVPLCDFCGKPPLRQGLWSSRVDQKHGHSECMDANPMVVKAKSS